MSGGCGVDAENAEREGAAIGNFKPIPFSQQLKEPAMQSPARTPGLMGSDSMKERAHGGVARCFLLFAKGIQNMPAMGARPAGAVDEAGAALAVRQMFESIAPKYDLLNHLLSANIDRLWWRRTARRFQAVLARPEAAILDICCGTGDLTMALLKLRPRGAQPILAGDFSPAMLRRGARKFGPPEFRKSTRGSLTPGAPYAVPLETDALHLPLHAESLDLIVTAFGFRNLANYEAGLTEFYRALKPGGQLGILEFGEPGGPLGKAYAALLPARAARHRALDLRKSRPLQLPANFCRRIPTSR